MSPLRATTLVFVIPTARLAESAGFYRDAIGLELLEEWSELGKGALFAASGGAQVEFDDVEDVPEPRVALGLETSGVDEVYERLTGLGIEAKAPPRVRPWGMYGFGVLDPNGVPINVYGLAPGAPAGRSAD